MTATECGDSPACWKLTRSQELATLEKFTIHQPKTIQIESARAAMSNSVLRATIPRSRACRRRRSVGRSVRDSFESSNNAIRRARGNQRGEEAAIPTEWYSVEEFARIVGRSDFTCREWCRHGRISAEKKSSGRGAYAAWTISHAELQRFQREGLRRPSSV